MNCIPLLLVFLLTPSPGVVAGPAAAPGASPSAAAQATSAVPSQDWSTRQPAPASIWAEPIGQPGQLTQPPIGQAPLGPGTTPDTIAPSAPTPLPDNGPSGAAAAPAQPLVDIVELPGGAKKSAGASPASAAPTETVALALDPPEGAALAGRPVSLSEALAVVRNTDGQRSVVHAYWNTVAMVARYNLRSRGRAILEGIDPRPGDELAMRAARGSSTAAVDEAQIAAIAAQHALAEKAFLPLPASELPLPSDRPCARPYETRYEQLFAGRPAPGQAWLIHHTLPLRQTAMEHRAGAVEAAAGHLAASQAAYRQGSVGLENVLAALSVWIREENAFMRSVCDYNDDIADYATAVLVGPTDSATLVSMLIGRRPQPVGEPIAPIGGVISTGGPVPIDGVISTGGPIPTATSPWAAPLPTLAPPDSTVQPASAIVPPLTTAGQAAAPSNPRSQPQPPADGAPNLLPATEPLVPIAPRNQTPPTEGNPTGQPTEGDAPKLLVVPVETPGATQP